MWYGKLSIIIYVFSFSFMFMAYFINQVLNDTYLSASNASYSYINGTLLPQFTFSPGFNSSLIFGDFISVFNFLVGLMSAGTLGNGAFQTMMGILPAGIGGPLDGAVVLLMGLLFDSATVFLLLYIFSFRSL